MLRVGFWKISSPSVSSFQNIGKRYFRKSINLNAENPRVVENREKEKNRSKIEIFS